MDILIKNATIVSSNQIIKGDLQISENRIIKISPEINEKTEFTIDGSNKIAIPGLVNSHTHVSMTMLRGYGEDLPLHRWLEEKIWPAEAKQTTKDVKLSALLAFAEMIRGGTTSFSDMCLFDTMPLFEAAKQIGIRGIISRGAIDLFDSNNTKKILSEITKSLDIDHSTDLVRHSLSTHSAYTCSEELLLKTKDLARRKNLKYQIHVSETRKEIFDILKKYGKYPYEFLNEIGLMDENSIFAHGGWLTKREILLAGSQKISVASCPISNLKLATGGIAQLVELHNAGANVCLGTDSVASNNSLDMFQTMKMAALLQKHHYWKADILPTKVHFDFATINGAKALGFDSGVLEEGKLADIVLLKKLPNLIPEYDIYSNLVYSAGIHNVDDVIIDGELILNNGKFTKFEEDALLAEAELAKIS